MKILGTPHEVVAPLNARQTPRDPTGPAPESPASGLDVASVSPAARARAAVPVDLDKVEQLKHELATEALSPNPTNIATIMLADPSGDGR